MGERTIFTALGSGLPNLVSMRMMAMAPSTPLGPLGKPDPLTVAFHVEELESGVLGVTFGAPPFLDLARLANENASLVSQQQVSEYVLLECTFEDGTRYFFSRPILENMLDSF